MALQVVEQEGLGGRLCRPQAVEVYLFATDVRAQLYHVAFVGRDIDQLVLPEEARDRRILLLWPHS